MATKKAAKAAPKKKAVVKKVAKKAPAAKKTTTDRPKKDGKIAKIIALHLAGKTNSEIIAKGFNKNTVSIQVGKYKRANA